MNENIKKELRTKYLWNVVRNWLKMRKFIVGIKKS